MEPLVFTGSKMTPNIVFDKIQEVFTMSGTSRPENPPEFYKPVFDWIKQYLLNPNEKTILDLQFDYFNTSTSKILLDLFEIFETHAENGIDIHINWFYKDDDEEMMEAGEELLNLVNISYSVKEWVD